MFGSRYTNQAQQQDIGFTVDTWLGTEDINPEIREKGVAALEEKGFCLMKGALTKEEVRRVQEILHIDISTTSPTSIAIDQTDKNVQQDRFTVGRMHSLLRGSSYDDKLRWFHKAWMPIVSQYMNQFNKDGSRMPFVSEVQIVLFFYIPSLVRSSLSV